MSALAVARLVYVLFFFSGASGLIYQVLWVREFGNVFGNTIYSASLVIAVFMSGLGLGSYLAGIWADRRYASAPASLLRAYGYCELGIAGLGFMVSNLLPQLGPLSAAISVYTQDAGGWYRLSTGSYVARYAIAVLLLAPITIAMGGTLTLLIRHLVRRNLGTAGWTIGALYGINTAGAAAGCFLTDYALIPSIGLLGTQLVAVSLNLIAALGALRLTSSRPPTLEARELPGAPASHGAGAAVAVEAGSRPLVAATGSAIMLSGFAAMGMEIVWFRHLEILLGSTRSVFSLLLTVILVGLWAGSIAGGYLHRRFGRPAFWYVLAQALFMTSALLGVASADFNQIASERAALAATVHSTSDWTSAAATELWTTLRPLLREVAIPSFWMGFAYPLANACIQRVETTVGQRAGLLYLANTLGAVLGALAAGFLLLPTLGIQHSVTVLTLTAALGLVPLWVASGSAAARPSPRPVVAGVLLSLAVAGTALAVWIGLPSNHVISRSLARLRPHEQRLTVSEGLTEVLAITEIPGDRRVLITNGHSMSGTSRVSQRYMRAFAHIPLLSLEAPERVLVIGFGVGNTLHAASLHPSILRLEAVDLSTNILAHAHYFSATNGGVLAHPRLSVYINDGRHHLRMQPPAAFDLVTMEPPPIAHAGVAALYSREFYRLVRTRLKPKGYITQWLPAYQVSAETTLSVVRAFIDVFPRSVLLSGFTTELILLGVNDSTLEIDPALIQARLDAAPAVREDLKNIALGTLTEIIGTFAGSAETLAGATLFSDPVTDDYPISEYAVRSGRSAPGIPPTLFDVSGVPAWCPKCFVDGTLRPEVADLGVYLTILGRLYQDPGFLEWPRRPSRPGVIPLDPIVRQTIARSPYLGQLIAIEPK